RLIPLSALIERCRWLTDDLSPTPRTGGIDHCAKLRTLSSDRRASSGPLLLRFRTMPEVDRTMALCASKRLMHPRNSDAIQQNDQFTPHGRCRSDLAQLPVTRARSFPPTAAKDWSV